MSKAKRIGLVASGLWKMRMFLILGGVLFAGVAMWIREPKAVDAPVVVAPAPEVEVPPPAAVDPVDHGLKAAVGFDGASFYVANMMPFDLVDVTVELEAGVFTPGWTAGVGRLRKTSGLSIGAARFQKENGTRFDVARDEASYARVSAHDKAGVAYESRSIAITAVR